MRYDIIIEPIALEDLQNIYKYISRNDSASKARKFINELKRHIYSLNHNLMKCRKSYYDKSENTRDLIHKGYTIVFKIIDSTVFVLSVFRQKNY